MDFMAKYWFVFVYFSCFLIFGIALGIVIFSNSTKMRFIRKDLILNGRKKFIALIVLFCGTIFFAYITIGSVSFMIQWASFSNKKMVEN